MTFAAPLFLWIGAAAALGVVLLHFLVRRQPVRWMFPTARFVPESRELAPARAMRLEDRLLLLLRVAAVTGAALAFARPAIRFGTRPSLAVIVADTSRAAADPAAVMREVERIRRDGDWVIAMAGRESLSSALVRAVAAARALRDDADSVSLAVVSPVAREELDAATAAIRNTWPGGITWIDVPAAAEPAAIGAVALRSDEDDPLRATLALAGLSIVDSAGVRLVRSEALSATDSAWAGASGVLVHWPDAAGPVRDTIGAVLGHRALVVAAFARPGVSPQGEPIAWWADGRAAAAETPLGGGCLRTVLIPVDRVGDLALGGRFRDLTRELLGPCGGLRDLRPADAPSRAALAGTATGPVSAAALPALPTAGRRAMPWLLGLALAALLLEQALRRRSPAP